MMRKIGFLAGVCLTIAAFLLILQTREKQQTEDFAETISDPTQKELSAVVAAIAEQVDVVQEETEPDVPPLSTPNSGTPDANIAPEPSDRSEVTQPEPESDPALPPDDQVAMVDDQLQNDLKESGIEPDQQPIDQAETESFNWQDSGDFDTYLFWSPFRSVWAAQGFAGRLTRATQVPVEVVNTGPGKYRAAFTYQDETERLMRIERIETITGLQLE